MRQRKAPHRIEQILKECGALGYLESLVREDCDRDQILAMLVTLQRCPQIDAWEFLAKTDLQTLKRKIAKIRNVARDIERLNSTFLSAFRTSLGFSFQEKFQRIPFILEWYATVLDVQRGFFGPKQHPMEEAAKAHLVLTVEITTGKPHDKEVSGLIAAVMNRPNYSEGDHGQWRYNHRRNLAIGRKMLSKDTAIPASLSRK